MSIAGTHDEAQSPARDHAGLRRRPIGTIFGGNEFK
jgi:hypothetical protein